MSETTSIDTQRIAHLECPGAVTGAMVLGALLDAGASVEAVRGAVEALGVGDVRITLGRVKRNGGEATLVRVRAPQETPSVRTWPQIRQILEFVALDEAVRERALATFHRLALAQARRDRLLLDEVVFHEVGALDMLADVVAVCAAVEDLGIDRFTVTQHSPEHRSPEAAALLGELAVPTSGPPAALDVHSEGLGAGPPDSERPNILRVLVGQPAS